MRNTQKGPMKTTYTLISSETCHSKRSGHGSSDILYNVHDVYDITLDVLNTLEKIKYIKTKNYVSMDKDNVNSHELFIYYMIWKFFKILDKSVKLIMQSYKIN